VPISTREGRTAAPRIGDLERAARRGGDACRDGEKEEDEDAPPLAALPPITLLLLLLPLLLLLLLALLLAWKPTGSAARAAPCA
jgi:hypothetical protein